MPESERVALQQPGPKGIYKSKFQKHSKTIWSRQACVHNIFFQHFSKVEVSCLKFFCFLVFIWASCIFHIMKFVQSCSLNGQTFHQMSSQFAAVASKAIAWPNKKAKQQTRFKAADCLIWDAGHYCKFRLQPNSASGSTTIQPSTSWITNKPHAFGPLGHFNRPNKPLPPNLWAFLLVLSQNLLT